MTTERDDTGGEDRRKSRQLGVLLIVYGVLVLVILAVTIVRAHPLPAILAQAGLLVCVLVCLRLLRRGRRRIAGLLFLLSWIVLPLAALASHSADWLLFTTMPYLLLPTVVVAGMLFTPSAAFAALAVVILGYGGALIGRFDSIGVPPGQLTHLWIPLTSGVLLATLSWLFGRDMSRALAEADRNARIAGTQLETTISLVADLVVAAARVAGLAEELTATMGYIRGGTEEIAEATGRVAAGAGDQAREVERTSESAAQLARATRKIASDTHETSVAAASSEHLVEDTATMVETLRQRLDAVDGVVRLVDKLADQTNLLALNASIEAARSGAAGAGFAVVAEEMQDLASRSAALVREIGGVIQDARRSLTPVLASIAKVQDESRRSQLLSEQVAVMTVQQEQSSDAMVAAMGSIAVVAERNAVATERIAASVEEQLASIEQQIEATQRLAEIAGDLRTIVTHQLTRVDDAGIWERICPSFAETSILQDLCFEEASSEMVRRYCMGDFGACVRKQFRDAGEPVPSDLRPDGTIVAEG